MNILFKTERTNFRVQSRGILVPVSPYHRVVDSDTSTHV